MCSNRVMACRADATNRDRGPAEYSIRRTHSRLTSLCSTGMVKGSPDRLASPHPAADSSQQGRRSTSPSSAISRATDSNQATHGGGQNSSSRIVIVNQQGTVTPFITGLPTGDHPTEQLAFKGGWIYWSQGST